MGTLAFNSSISHATAFTHALTQLEARRDPNDIQVLLTHVTDSGGQQTYRLQLTIFATYVSRHYL